MDMISRLTSESSKSSEQFWARREQWRDKYFCLCKKATQLAGAGDDKGAERLWVRARKIQYTQGF